MIECGASFERQPKKQLWMRRTPQTTQGSYSSSDDIL
jgi:hypothetical protein